MPLFSNKQPGDAATWEPQAAAGRLAHTAGAAPAGVFTSDLSVSEYVLLGEAGALPPRGDQSRGPGPGAARPRSG